MASRPATPQRSRAANYSRIRCDTHRAQRNAHHTLKCGQIGNDVVSWHHQQRQVVAGVNGARTECCQCRAPAPHFGDQLAWPADVHELPPRYGLRRQWARRRGIKFAALRCSQHRGLSCTASNCLGVCGTRQRLQTVRRPQDDGVIHPVILAKTSRLPRETVRESNVRQ